MKYSILFISLMTIFFSCKKEFATQEIKTSYESVMAVHDEVMPKISKIQRYKKKLRKLDNKDNQVKSLIKNLSDADDGMMDWMAEFKLDQTTSSKEQMIYLKNEQIRINKVSVDMLSSIDAARKYLENHTNK